MVEKIKTFVSGEKIGDIPFFHTTFKNTMIQLMHGYPLYESYGIWETYLDKEVAELLIERLKKDNLLEVREKEGQEVYRLTPDGIRLTISLINLNYAEKMHNQTNKINNLTDWIRALTIVLVIIGLGNFLLIWLQLFKTG